MALTIGDDWIRSDQCAQVAKAISDGGWVLSWRSGRYDRDQAILAMTRAEQGDLLTDPTGVAPTS
jgi:hypothetical protein